VRRTFRYFALIPAAGTGSRMGVEGPKQYAKLGSKTMLEHSIDAMLADGRIDNVFVIVAQGDTQWQALAVDAEHVEFLPVGGSSRAESVRNGLIAIACRTGNDDRVLVHDAARPCLAEEQLARLIDEVGNDDRGGLLAVPLTDTLKRGDDGRVGATIARHGMWCAQTPQLFRVGSLRAALSAGPLDDVTDDASAIERSGNSPRLVPGSTTNIKVTTTEDLVLARAILAEQGRLDSPNLEQE
jgi:2-C-methyl-D-erythritol 4-phosphate cytidylyltransferase